MRTPILALKREPIPQDVLEDIATALADLQSYPANAYGHRDCADILQDILDQAGYDPTTITIQAKESE